VNADNNLLSLPRRGRPSFFSLLPSTWRAARRRCPAS